MNKKEFKLCIISILISSIFVTILSNFKFFNYDKYFLFPITILLITFLFVIYKKKMVVNKKGYIYLLPICAIILGTFFFKTNISNMIINVFILPALISILFLKLTNINYNMSGNFLKWFYYLFPYKLFNNLKIVKDNVKIAKGDNKKIKNIIKGILISIPFVIVIILLLTSADMYFSAFLDKAINKIIVMFNIEYVINNILTFVIFFIIAFSVLVNIINAKDKVIASGKKKSVEVYIVNTVLIIVNFVFVLFVISEISKLAGNFLKLPSMYTYAEYAREGFFQLLLVTVINFSILFFLIYKTDTINKNGGLKCLVLILIMFTILLIFNSYYRMFLYMYEYGFTVLRTQVILFLLMELIIAVLFIKKLISGLKYMDANTITWVIIITYVINIIVCNNNIIALINNYLGYIKK